MSRMFRKKGKSGIQLQIPGFGDRYIKTILADYDGTLCCNGNVRSGLKDQLIRLADAVEIHVLTADKKAKSKDCFGGLPVHIHILSDADQDVQKREYLKEFIPVHVAVFGNGNNDRLLFEAVRSAGGLCIAVDNGEGCAIDVILHAHLFIHDASKALGLLLDPEVCAAGLRY
jgi:soluble P-type ATPase